MHLRLGSKAGRDRIEEITDVLGAMPVRHRAHPRAGGDIEGRQQCGGAVPFVVMRAGGPLPRGRWQGLLGPAEGLDPGRLVNREDNSMVGRVGGQPHPIMDPGPSRTLGRSGGRSRPPQ